MNLHELVSWRIINEGEVLELLKQDVILLRGNHNDDRDESIQKSLSENSKIITIAYDFSHIKLSISISGFDTQVSVENEDPVIASENLATFINDFGYKVIFDITSLETESIFMLLKAFREISFDNIIAVYVQPSDYSLERDSVLMPSFLLSDERSPISSIPGFMVLPNDLPSVLVAFLGFESGRFQELREYVQADGNTEIRPIIPIPSYSAGWHMRTLYLNLTSLKESETLNDLKRVTAWDPFYALSVLKNVYNELSNDFQINVAPLGTKPHTLATALFAIHNENVRIMYDHPKASFRRSIGTGPIRGYILKGLL